jgi:hypothetical protein
MARWEVGADDKPTTQRMRRRVEGSDEPVPVPTTAKAARAASDGRLLIASAGHDGVLRVVDVAVGGLVTRESFEHDIQACAFTPDATALAVVIGGDDGPRVHIVPISEA